MSELAILGGQPIRTKSFPKWPQVDKMDEKVLLDVLHSGKWGRGMDNGRRIRKGSETYINKLEGTIADIHKSKYGLVVSNGTAALDLAMFSLGINEGDEVIVTPYSYIASSTCILQAGAIPVFADVDIDTWNIDVDSIEKSITDKTKAIVVVHFGGQPAEMDKIMELANKYNLKVIEDAAHGFGAEYDGKPVGIFGDIGCFSFQESKNITCGEGGALVTNYKSYYEKAHSLHMTGRVFGGQWYEHSQLGWNYRITQFQAALAYSQIQRIDSQDELRQLNAQYLNELLKDIPGIEVTKSNTKVTKHVYHIYTFRYDQDKWDGLSRRRFIMALNAEGIPCHKGYSYPIYKNPLFLNMKTKDYGQFQKLCPNAERICSESIWLPHNVLLGTKKDMDDISNAILKVHKNINKIRR